MTRRSSNLKHDEVVIRSDSITEMKTVDGKWDAADLETTRPCLFGPQLLPGLGQASLDLSLDDEIGTGLPDGAEVLKSTAALHW
jgi:hypothetical protein